jgi:hypothetical protein
MTVEIFFQEHRLALWTLFVFCLVLAFCKEMLLQSFNLNDLFTFPACSKHRAIFPIVDVYGVFVEIWVNFVTKIALLGRYTNLFLTIIVLLLLVLIRTVVIVLLFRLLSLVLLVILPFMFRTFFLLNEGSLSLIHSFLSDIFLLVGLFITSGVNIRLNWDATLPVSILVVLSAFTTVNFS